MNRRGLPLVIVAALLLLAVGGACSGSDGEGQPPLTSSQVPTVVEAVPTATADARPTSALGHTTHTLQGALNQAREIFTAAPPYVIHDIASVSYADTTIGKARALFDPEGVFRAGEWFADADEALRVWAIVAAGEFQTRPAPGSGAPRNSFSAVWIVFAQGEGGRAGGSLNEMIDLSSLGTVVEISGPLAEYPTPVQLN